MSTRGRDAELYAIQRIMTILVCLPPIARARVLEYVVSRVESLGGTAPVDAETETEEERV